MKKLLTILLTLSMLVSIVPAFAVSAAFVFGDHLAFTLSYNSAYIVAVIVGKLVAGDCIYYGSNCTYS